MPDAPKRHHVVPQFYLRGFAESEQLISVQVADGKRFTSALRNAASENHFYRLTEDHVEGPLGFEEALERVETAAARVFQTIHNGVWPLSFKDRQELSFFIGAQLIRGPRYRRALVDSGASGINYDGSTMTAVDMHAHQIATLAEQWMPHLMNRPWDLVRFTDHSLITSDSPVSSIQPVNYDSGRWVGAPFAVAEDVLYPVSRKVGLLMRDSKSIDAGDRDVFTNAGLFDRIRPGTSILEKRFNWSTAATATRFLFHNPRDGRFVPPEVPEPPTSSDHDVRGWKGPKASMRTDSV
jgi:hypothetical protein